MVGNSENPANCNDEHRRFISSNHVDCKGVEMKLSTPKIIRVELNE